MSSDGSSEAAKRKLPPRPATARATDSPQRRREPHRRQDARRRRLLWKPGLGLDLQRSPDRSAENLEDLACAGVPIHDPISGRLVGVVDLTCWRKDAESLLLTLAKATAEQIQHALLVTSSLREFEVLQAYRQTCRRTTGIVFALTSDDVMLNKYARAELAPSEQAALLAHAAEASAGLAAGTPSG